MQIIIFKENVTNVSPSVVIPKHILSKEILDKLTEYRPKNITTMVGIEISLGEVKIYLQNFDAHNGIHYDCLTILEN